MPKTVAQKNRGIRQDALREFLSNQKLIESVLDLAEKIEALEDEKGADLELKKYKTSAELKLRLISKYLPDVKQVEVEHSGEINGTYTVSDTPKIDEFDREFAVGSATGATDRPH